MGSEIITMKRETCICSTCGTKHVKKGGKK